VRELDSSPLAIVGAGRLGTALAAALRAADLTIQGPLGRGGDATGAGAVLLCVPDGEIASAAAAIAPGPLVGHCSGATTLQPLAPHEAFSLHPLMTVPKGAGPEVFAGAGAAIAGSTPRALEYASTLAERLGLHATEVADEDRVAYHAAAAIAANFVTTLLGAAERLAPVERPLLVPLVTAAVDNWARLGAEAALTGPIVRGDEETVARQRAAVKARAPEILPMWDALVAATRDLAAGVTPVGGAK
jgi:predicted short-subunit dehydrogenase-like oxidoreductase (DUF2520 family)